MSIVTALGAAVGVAGQPAEGDGELPFRLSEAQPPAVAASAAVEAEPLTDAELRPLLARLGPVAEEETDAAEYRLPARSPPPSAPGQAVALPFPPPAGEETDAPADHAGGAALPLAVARAYPRGEIAVAPHVGVTFNQPLVALGSPREPASADNPVTFTPAVPGRWRWVGTDTLLFEPAAGRLPMATEFRVRVAAGTTSAAGNVLPEAEEWTFRTAAPAVTTVHPEEGSRVGLQPVLFAAFDQPIDPAAVLEHVSVTAAGQARPVRLAGADEIEADAEVRSLAEEARAGRWLAFVPVEPLPPATAVTVTVAAGTPAVEGPLATERAQRSRFQTMAPLRLRGHGCRWRGSDCGPGDPWELAFNNPLDDERFDPGLIVIRPEMANAGITVVDNEVQIEGASRAGTTYTVTVAAGLTDAFGQQLGHEAAVRFDVGRAAPLLAVPEEDPATLLSGDAVFPVRTVNADRLRVRAFRVAPEQFRVYWQGEYRYAREVPKGLGDLVMDRTVRIGGADDAWAETGIDLAGVLNGAAGHLILHLTPSAAVRDQGWENGRAAVRWVQVTGLGLTTYADQRGLLAWVSRLADGAPLAGVNVKLQRARSRAITASTDGSGTARLPLPSYDGEFVLIARAGDDAAFLPVRHWRDSSTSEATMSVFDDRRLYRPGETAAIKGWLRRARGGPTGDLELFRPRAADRVSYRVKDARNNEVAVGDAPLSPLGGFHFQIELPQQIDLGMAWIRLRPAGGTLEAKDEEELHLIDVREFRRPEFEVQATVSGGADGGFHVGGGHAVLTAAARYFAGGPLPGAAVEWRVNAEPASYAPPRWSSFTFGTWVPWWRRAAEGRGREDRLDFGADGPDGRDGDAPGSATFRAATGANGAHHLRVDFVPGAAVTPVRIDATATVLDVNRQAWSGDAGLLVHPADRYVGLRAGRYFVEQGEPLTVEAAVTDVDGAAVAGHEVAVRAALIGWEQRGGEWQEVEREVQECVLLTTAADGDAAADPHTPPGAFASCSFETPHGGEYRVTATVTDAAGRRNRTELTRWVSGGGYRPAGEGVTRQELRLIPDRDAYQAGDRARILVQAPFFPAEGMLTLGRNGLAGAERFSLTGPTHTLEVSVTEQFIPNVHLQVDLLGAAEGRPAYATGRLDLPVPPASRTLQVEVAPRAASLPPGGRTTIDVTVRDAAGAPVADAEVAVVVVDEAVLSLAGFLPPDPVRDFYPQREAGVEDHDSRASLALSAEEARSGRTAGAQFAIAEHAFERDGAVYSTSERRAPVERGAQPLAVRQDLAPRALFAPEVRTGAGGGAAVPVTLPDNLTRYRIIAVAAAGARQFGTGESALTARLPLMVRPSAPRFLNYGDRFELPVVVQNQTETALPVHVAVRAGNASVAAGPGEAAGTAAGYAVTVPAGDRTEVRFPAAAARAGTARFRVAAVAATDPAIADAAAVELPVFTSAVSEAFAAYGQLDALTTGGGAAALHHVQLPGASLPGYGGLQVSLSSTLLQSLTDAFLYLVRYPYACSEQIASLILGVAALRPVLAAFAAAGLPEPAAIDRTMADNLKTLQSLQDRDGGFPIWRHGERTWAYHSVHAAHALARAREQGYAVRAEVLDRSRAYLRNIEKHVPGDYDRSARRALEAYALYVRALLGDRDPAAARRLATRAGLRNLSAESIGWLLSVLAGDPDSAAAVGEIVRFVNDRVTETAGAATIATGYEDGAYLLLHSGRRSDAVLLEGLIAAQPDRGGAGNGLIVKLVRGLLGHRVKGRWANTQENVWVLLALERYFRTFESRRPDFSAGVWLGGRYAGGREFRGRSAEQVSLEVPLEAVRSGAGEGEAAPLIVGAEGAGRLYYRLGLRYAAAGLRQEAAAHGFGVERRYAAVDDPADVSRDADGAWRIRAGSRVRVELTLAVPARRVHVALVDPLPAGLEILDPALSEDAGGEPEASPRHWWGWATWYEHRNLRDDRAEAFASYLSAGVYRFRYTARATTPGAFVVPAATAEEMYAPETFARTAGDRVLIVTAD